MKSNKGITLVALVITIIVLLILAGVTISVVVGDNGILSKAQSASDETDKSSAESAVETAIASLSTSFMGDNWANNVNDRFYTYMTQKKLNDELVKNGYKLIYMSSDAPTTSNCTGNTALQAETPLSKATYWIAVIGKNAGTNDTRYKIQIELGDYGATIKNNAEIVN